MGIPMLKIRRSNDRLILNVGIPIPENDGLYIEMGPRTHVSNLNMKQYWALQLYMPVLAFLCELIFDGLVV